LRRGQACLAATSFAARSWKPGLAGPRSSVEVGVETRIVALSS